MPRSPTFPYAYTYPVGTPAVPGGVIGSTPYNGYIADVQTVLNEVQRVNYGGTGASTVEAARVVLDVPANSRVNYFVTGGTADALTLTPTTIASLSAGESYWMQAVSNNTTAATLNVSGLGALAIRKIVSGADVAIVAGDILAKGRYQVEYDATANSSAGGWILTGVVPVAASAITGVLGETHGGTNQSTYTQGDILYASAANTLSKLGKGTAGTILTQGATIPAWGGAVGTWTPTLESAGASFTYTRFGTYAQIGNIVFCSCTIAATTATGLSSAQLYIGGLPVTPSAMNGGSTVSMTWNTMAVSIATMSGRVLNSDPRIQIIYGVSSATNNVTAMPSNALSAADSAFELQFFYFV